MLAPVEVKVHAVAEHVAGHDTTAVRAQLQDRRIVARTDQQLRMAGQLRAEPVNEFGFHNSDGTGA